MNEPEYIKYKLYSSDIYLKWDTLDMGVYARGHLLTPRGIVNILAGQTKHSGDYTIMTFVYNGYVHRIQFDKMLSKKSMIIRANRFTKEIAGGMR